MKRVARDSAFGEAEAAQAFEQCMILDWQLFRAAVPRLAGKILSDRVDLRFQFERLGKRRPPPVKIPFQPQCAGQVKGNPPYLRSYSTRRGQIVCCQVNMIQEQ